MNEHQRFLFDLQGYLVVEDVLDADVLQRMNADLEAHDISSEKASIDFRFGSFLNWSDDWRGLIDNPTILPLLAEMLGPKFRLDHAYGMAQKPEKDLGKNGGLHHQAAMFGHGCYYVSHGDKMHNGLIVVSFALTDVPEGAGGFCCVPGSHKSLYPMPEGWYRDLDANPVVKNVSMKAGSVLIFTEALTHGTAPWQSATGERRAALMKYCPLYMKWGQQAISADDPALTERQRSILTDAYVWDRPAIAMDAEATV